MRTLMKGRLFLGIRITYEQRSVLQHAPLSFTTLEGKDFCGFVIPAQTTLKEIQTQCDQLDLIMQTYLPGVRLPSAMLFSELLLG